MQLHCNRSEQFVYGGVRFSDRMTDNDSPFTEFTARSDPMRTILGLSAGFIKGYDPLLLCGVKGGRVAEVRAVAQPKPTQLPYNAVRDNLDYGRGLWSFFHGAGDHTGRLVLESRENLVTHCRFIGDVELVPKDAVLWAPTTTVEMLGVVIPAFTLDAFGRLNLIDTFHFHNGVATAHFTPRGGVKFYTSDALKACRDELNGGEYNVGDAFWIDNAKHGISIKGMSYEISESLIQVDYVVRYRKYDLFMHVKREMFREVSISIRLEDSEGAGLRSGTDNIWSSCKTCSITTVSTYYDAKGFLGEDVPPGWLELCSRGPLTESVSWDHAVEGFGYILNDASISESDIRSTLSLINSRYTAFSEAVEAKHDALTAGAFYSTGEALHGWFDVIQTNVIEFLTEARDIAAMLPNVRGLVEIYKDIRKCNLLKAGWSLLDFVTDSELYYNFGLRPNTQLATEFVDKHDRLFRTTPASLSGKKTLYGRYHHTESFDDYEWSIDFTSKVRLVVPNSILLFGVFGLNSLGLLPSPGNIWQAIKSSWIVDALFGIGAKLKAVDTQGILLLLDAGIGTHSYTVKQRKVLGDLSTLGLRSVNSEEPYGLYYYRGVSALLPSLRGCEFDYNPGSPPSCEVGLSFVYKKMGF